MLAPSVMLLGEPLAPLTLKSTFVANAAPGHAAMTHAAITIARNDLDMPSPDYVV
jgi:hypothetical protein